MRERDDARSRVREEVQSAARAQAAYRAELQDLQRGLDEGWGAAEQQESEYTHTIL